MYTNNNPFGGWADASSGQTPSVFGALPYPSAPSASNLVTFYFTSFNPHVLNCTVLGPHSQPYFQVVTDVTMPGYTVIKNVKGSSVALIEWQAHPLIEIRGVLSKQNVGRWLRLSSDRSSRTMEVRGMSYIWAPQDKSINLFTGGASNPTCLARVTRGQHVVTLDMTPDAIQLGLLDSVVAAALLLQCGRNID